MGMKQYFLFFEKKIQNGRLKKSEFFKIANSQIFLWKSVRNYVIEWMGLNFDIFPGFQQIPYYA